MHYNSHTDSVIINVIIIITFTINHLIVLLVEEEYPLLTAFMRFA